MRRSSSLLTTLLALAALAWVGAWVSIGKVDLAAVQDNGCAVVQGNGTTNTNPSAACPVRISLGNVLTTSAGNILNLAAGDTSSRPIDVSNAGNSAFDRLSLTTTPASGALASSLRLTLRRCSVAWTVVAGAYTCQGTATTLLSNALPMQNDLTVPSSPAQARNGTDRLLASVTLLGSAGNAVEGSTTSLTYSFTATRSGGAN